MKKYVERMPEVLLYVDGKRVLNLVHSRDFRVDLGLPY
jgi:hypothetical protein